MTDFTSVWDDAGESAEQAESARALAVAKQASIGTQQFLFLAKDETDFNHRVALAEESLFKAAVAAGVSPEDLVAEHRREFGLVLEAKRAAAPEQAKQAAMPPDSGLVNEVYGGDPNRPRTCPNCNGSRAVPAQGHESYHEVSNGQVRCPTCAGHGVVAPRMTDVTEPSYDRDPGDVSDDWYSRFASIRTALAEGQDPLEWLEEASGGQGQPEVEGGHTTGNEQTTPNLAAQSSREAGGRPFVGKEAVVKEAFDWLKKNPATTAPSAPAEDPLAGRAECPCGSRMTAPMGGGSDKHKCWNCDTVFTPHTGAKVASDGGPYSREDGGPSDYGWPGDNSGVDRSERQPGEVKVHRFNTTGEAYDHSQFDDDIKDGDVLHVPSEGVTGFLNEAWPVALHHGDSTGAFHGLGNGHTADQVFRGPGALSGKDYSATLDKAREVHEGSRKEGSSRPF